MGTEKNSKPENFNFDLTLIIRDLFDNKLLSIAIIFSVVISSVWYAISLPNIYKTESVLLPVGSGTESQLGKLGSQFGGIASLAGINLTSGGGADKTTVAIETMQSREFLMHFIDKNDLLALVIATDGWDLTANQPIYDSELYDEKQKKWLREVSYPRKSTPSLLEAAVKFRENFNVSYDSEAGIISASLEYFSPELAQSWLTMLIEDINRNMQESDRLESKESIMFLEKQIKNTNVAESKVLLYSMIQDQLQKLMFTEIRKEYVFKTIDAPYLPELKVKPSRSVIVILGAVLGGVLAVLILVLKRVYRVLAFRA